MRLYRYFLDGIPAYLARHYWWAYLWRGGVWIFDHQPIINAILFGRYKALMATTLAQLESAPTGRVLQLTCVYGSLTPALVHALSPAPLHIADVAPVQLRLALGKAPAANRLLAARMQAEQLGYKKDVFTTVVVFFLLHEMPPAARRATLSECLRIMAPGGRLLLTEYNEVPDKHWLFRFPPSRRLLTQLEPFLADFWREDLYQLLVELAAAHGKRVEILSNTTHFRGFYRITVFCFPPREC